MPCRTSRRKRCRNISATSGSSSTTRMLKLIKSSSWIALPVAVDIQPPHHMPAAHGRLPDRGVDRLALPRDVARQPHIDRKQAYHGFLLYRNGRGLRDRWGLHLAQIPAKKSAGQPVEQGPAVT